MNAARWQRIHLATGILERDGRVLLVASRYPNQPRPLWNLPGGRQEPPETLAQTVVREFSEETGLAVAVGALAYVAESFDERTHTQFTTFAFRVRGDGSPHVGEGDLHAVDCGWFTREEMSGRLAVAVVREPLLAHLGGSEQRYFGYGDPGITIQFAD